MAKLGVIKNLSVYHKGILIKFRVKVIIEGNIINGWVLGESAIKLHKEIDDLLDKIKLRDITKTLEKEKITYRGMESIAIYILKRLNFVKKIEIFEGQDEFAIVSRSDL